MRRSPLLPVALVLCALALAGGLFFAWWHAWFYGSALDPSPRVSTTSARPLARLVDDGEQIVAFVGDPRTVLVQRGGLSTVRSDPPREEEEGEPGAVEVLEALAGTRAGAALGVVERGGRRALVRWSARPDAECALAVEEGPGGRLRVELEVSGAGVQPSDFAREHLFPLEGVPRVIDLVVDPRERYALLLDEPRAIWRVDLDSGTLERRWTPAELPGLEGAHALDLRHHAVHGRAAVAQQRAPHLGGRWTDRWVVLVDADDDGTFEEVRRLNLRQVLRMGLEEPAWHDFPVEVVLRDAPPPSGGR